VNEDEIDGELFGLVLARRCGLNPFLSLEPGRQALTLQEWAEVISSWNRRRTSRPYHQPERRKAWA